MVVPAISIVTPTHDRPLLFSLTEKWMKPALEDYKGEVQWIVADDGESKTPLTLGQESAYKHSTVAGIPSFLDNMRRGLAAVKHDYVVIVEDDDWNCSTYLTNMLSLFTKPEIGMVGEGCAKYYHIPTMSYFTHRNRFHASWCQTAFRAEYIPRIQQIINRCNTYLLDMRVWESLIKDVKTYVKPTSDWKIGIKGLMRGNALGAGHTTRMYRSKDHYGQVLKKWVGEDAAEVYFDLIKSRPAYAEAPKQEAVIERPKIRKTRWAGR